MFPEARDIARFSFYAPVLKAVEGEDGEWVLEGPLSEPGADLQGESMTQGEWGKSGLRKGLETFTALGKVVDWEHRYERTRDPEAIIGKGLELYDAPHPVTGAIVPWLKVRLLKGQKLAQKAWNYLKSGGALGFSVAGAALRKAGDTILEPLITTIAITAVPVVSRNAGTIRLCKALEELEATDADLSLIDLFEPELEAEGVVPLYRALSATGSLPRIGPGIDAASVEDLGTARRASGFARVDDDEDEEAERRRKRRLRLKVRPEEVRKALAFHLGEALAGTLAG